MPSEPASLLTPPSPLSSHSNSSTISPTLAQPPHAEIHPPGSSASLASIFLHPASLAASLAGYPPAHPWTALSWMNAAAAAYGFMSPPSSSGAVDLSPTGLQRSPLSSIADLRMKAKRQADELANVSLNNNKEQGETGALQRNSPIE